MQINQIFELSLMLSNEKFQEILTKADNRSDYLEETEEGYIDHTLASKGILVIYRESQYKKKVKLIINVSLVVDCDKHNPDKLIRKLEKRIGEYFDYKYQMDDFQLSGMGITVDIDVHDHRTVSAYLKVLKRIGKVKGFSPSSYDCFDDESSLYLDGNSNAIEFLLYDLQ